MKKLIVGLFAALLTSVGFVAVSSAPASAACTQYVCNNTTAKAKTPKVVPQGKKAKVKVQVQTRGASVKASGKATITVKGPGGFSKKIPVTIKNGKIANVNLGKLAKAGKYRVTVKFKGDEGFRDSTAKSTITVKKKKRR